MTRQQFMKALAEYPGVTWDHESEEQGNVVQIDAPKGKVFGANGCHTMVVQFANNGGQSWKPEAYDEAIGLLRRYGLSDCDTPDCDICEEMI